MTFSTVLPLFRLGLFRSIGLLLYLYVQYILLKLLSPQDFSTFVAFNSLSMLLGQVSTAGIDGKLVSNLHVSSDFRFTPSLLKNIFEYVPFSFLVVFLFFCCSKVSFLGLGVVEPSTIEFFFVFSICFLQPLMSTLLVLADKANRPGISDVIGVAPWLLRSLLLYLFPFSWFGVQFPFISSLELVFFFYILSLCLVLCAVFIYCGGQFRCAFSAFCAQLILILSAPSSFLELFATNFVYLSSGFSSSAPVLLAPLILRGSTVSALRLQDFSVAFVILGIVQSCGSQFLMRKSVARILSIAKRSNLSFALRYSFVCIRPLLVLYVLFIIALSVISFSPSIVERTALQPGALRLFLLMSFGLVPSAIASLWHALFNLRRYLVLGFVSRLLGMIVSLPLIIWLVQSHETVGGSIGLAVFPLITLLSFCFVLSFLSKFIPDALFPEFE